MTGAGMWSDRHKSAVRDRQGRRRSDGERDDEDDGYHPVRKGIGINTRSVRTAGRATMGVKLLDLDGDDEVAAATVIPPEDSKSSTESGISSVVAFASEIRLEL